MWHYFDDLDVNERWELVGYREVLSALSFLVLDIVSVG